MPKKFKELTAKLSESKYGDAMSSRLPSHLDDPRDKGTVKPSAAYLKAKKKRALHFANKGDIQVKKSVYESYRDQALEESVGSVPNAAFNESGPETYKVGDKVHVGVGTKGGAGHVGIIHKMNSDEVHVKIGVDKYGDRIIRAPHRLVSLHEDTSGGGYKVGDRVVPKIGPHKGEMHRVIHVHDTGHLNITPENKQHKNRYHLGAAKAHPNDVTRAEKLEESFKTWVHTGHPFHKAVEHAKDRGHRITYGTQSKKWHVIGPNDRDYHTSFALDPDEAHRQGEATSLLSSTSARRLEESKHPEGMTNFGKKIKLKDYFDPFKHKKGVSDKQEPRTGLESKKYRNLAENPIVREAFEAAKAKKKDSNLKPNDFQEPKDMKSPGQQDPQQADLQAKPAPFGGQQPQGAPEKQSNAPKPEKKTDKLTVKGPGVEDAFQKEPTVAGLTTLVKA
jgi:hypothetical protein